MTPIEASAADRPGNQQVRWIFAAIIVFSGFVVAVVGLAGVLASDVSVAERFLLLLINPVAAVAAIWAMLDDDFFMQRRPVVAMAAVVALAANLVTSLSLYAGWSSGDGEIPLILAVPSAAFLGYHFVTPGRRP